MRCEGCQNLHLVADNLKWFDEKSSNIEELMEVKGQEVKKIFAEGPLKEMLIEKMKK